MVPFDELSFDGTRVRDGNWRRPCAETRCAGDEILQCALSDHGDRARDGLYRARKSKIRRSWRPEGLPPQVPDPDRSIGRVLRRGWSGKHRRVPLAVRLPVASAGLRSSAMSAKKPPSALLRRQLKVCIFQPACTGSGSQNSRYPGQEPDRVAWPVCQAAVLSIEQSSAGIGEAGQSRRIGSISSDCGSIRPMITASR